MPEKSEPKKLTKEEIEILLVKYQKAQDSAEHHDNLFWTVTTIIFSALLLLIGFIIRKESNNILITYLILFGIFLSIVLWFLARDFRRIKNFYYNKSDEILRELRMNCCIDRELFKILISKPERGGQWELYTLAIVLFIVLWIVILLSLYHISF